jgi:hypothetical protein
MIVQSLRRYATERIPGAMAALAAKATGAMPRGVRWHYCPPPVVGLELELGPLPWSAKSSSAVNQG